MRRNLAVVLVSACVAVTACDKQPEAVAAQGGDATGDDGGGTAADGLTSGSGSGQVDGEADSTGSPVQQNVPARAITITRVEANPGVAIPIIENGAWIDGPQRRAQIPKGRNTAFRVYVDIDEGSWVQREIEGRLTVIQSDGTEEVLSEVVEIGTDSSETSLQANFLFGVVAEQMNPGAKVRVELFEAGGDYEALPAAEAPPQASANDEFIGVEASEQKMKVMIVPVNYSFGGCSTQTDTSPEALAPYEDAMFQQNGLETIELMVREPISVTDLDLTDGNDFFQFLNRIVQLRAQDAPDPNVYYYGLFDNCGVCIGDGGGCLLGVAPGLPGDSMGEAGSRAAIGTRFLSNSEVGIETFVHEIGHTQGRQHVACPGGSAAGPDVTYPHANGSIGVWGFGVRDFAIRNPTNHTDYMSYCNPTWVSDWQWKATYERIRTLSSWDAADMSGGMETSRILVGAVNTQTGESEWWTDRGWVEPGDVAASATLRYTGGAAPEQTAVDIDPWSEGPWITVRAPLANSMDFTAVELRTADATFTAPRHRVKMFATAP